ncbi:MAG: hypothetical protein M3Y21_03335 [Candidatus Eremiobacteraeota bacterium]|nr:hypothetical protein [Candidatus Eremiobacteraeota bacterium]
MSAYRKFALILICTIAVTATLISGVLASQGIIHPPFPIPHPTMRPPAATPTPSLPFNVRPESTPTPFGSKPPLIGGVTWHSDASLRRPARVPKISDFLQKTGRGTYSARQMASPMSMRIASGGRVHPLSADGQTIILTGDLTNFFENDITLSYGSAVFVTCNNMAQPNGNYRYVVFPPDGKPALVSAFFAVDNGGNCVSGGVNNYGTFNLSTPATVSVNGNPTTVHGDPAYPGVWVIVMQDQSTMKYDAEINIVANATVHFDTYSDVGLAHQTADFTPGNLMAVGASGLNAAHYYAIGYVYTSGGGLPCDFTKPASGIGNNGSCFTGSPPGIQAFGGNLEEWWGPSDAPSSSTAKTGMYDVQLYDTTSQELISHQQIAVDASTAAWALTPYNSVAGNGVNLGDTFATDGLVDQSVTGLTYAATGLPAASNGHSLFVTISDPNGSILTTDTGYPTMSQPVSVNQAAGAISKKIAFPLNVGLQTAFGPTQTPFAPNVFTAQLYDQTLAKVISSKSFQLLGYGANFAWPAAAIINVPTTPTAEAVKITNTGGSNFGVWNGDSVSGITIATNPADGELLSISSTTAVDSAGNGWNITITGVGVNAVIKALPQQSNVGFPPGGSLQFNVGVAVPAGKCASPCYLHTTMLPLHGIAFSAADKTTNTLEVLENGVPPTTVSATYAWAVTGENATANLAARIAYFNQLTYVDGTSNAPSSDYYTINLTVNNKLSPGGFRLMDMELTFPGAIDLNGNQPTLTASPAGWVVQTNAQNPALGGQNVLELTCQATSNNSCGIVQGSAAATFTLRFPIFQTSFTEQEIPAIANFDGGCGSCSAPSFSLNPVTAKNNAIAGLTNVDSGELGAFSLNPNLMSNVFTPNTVGTGAPTTATMTFTNTSSTSDPNPDYVDQINLIFPNTNNINPASITVPAGWVATQKSADNWTIALCANPTNAVPCANPEPTALAPGQQLTMTMHYPAGPFPNPGTYNVQWWATGANGGASTKPIVTNASITFSSTTASVAFTSIGGIAVPNGTEPQVGTDTNFATGNQYVFVVTNTGSTNIDTANITVPGTTRSGTSGQDSAGMDWTITTAPVITLSGGSTGTNGTCSGTLNGAQYASASGPSTNGFINLTGCVLKPGGTATVTFNAKAPYLIGNEFVWATGVKSGPTNVAATSVYTAANVVKIILNGTLTIITPALGFIAPTSPNSITPQAGSGATPSTSCVSCQMLSLTPANLDFGYFTGNFLGTDVVDASVFSDANGANTWQLFVTTAPGPNPAGGAGPMLSTNVDAPRSSSGAGFTVTTPGLTTVATTTPGLQLAGFNGASALRKPLDSIMSYNINTGGVTSPQTVTLTFTLVFP